MRERGGGEASTSSAGTVSVTARSAMRATSGASTKRGPRLRLDDDPVEDVLARVVLHAPHAPDLDAVAAAHERAAAQCEVGGRRAVGVVVRLVAHARHESRSARPRGTGAPDPPHSHPPSGRALERGEPFGDAVADLSDLRLGDRQRRRDGDAGRERAHEQARAPGRRASAARPRPGRRRAPPRSAPPRRAVPSPARTSPTSGCSSSGRSARSSGPSSVRPRSIKPSRS